MKNILFIVNSGKISSNENGGASVYYSHLEMLYKAGFKIKMLVVQWSDEDEYIKEDYVDIVNFIESIESYKILRNKTKKDFNRYVNALIKPEVFEYNFINQENTNYLQNFIEKNKISLVFAEWRWAGIWTGFSDLSVPVVYSHHDWEFKLAKLRKKRSLVEKFHTFQKKRVEQKLVRNVEGSISGSITEANEIQLISGKQSLYIPTTYKNVVSKLSPNTQPKIVHLGGMATTANRIGLERFLDICWPVIKEQHSTVELVVIGSLNMASERLLNKLNDSRINCLGFVKDLTQVLYPLDIHIIPWEYNTGTRTRLPLVLNYEQILVSTEASVRAFPEIKHQNNAIICRNLEEMAREICILLDEKDVLKRISKEGKNTFLSSYTVQSQFPKLKKYLNNIIANF